MNISMPLEAVMENPRYINNYSVEIVGEIIRQLLAQGCVDKCLEAIRNIPFSDFDYAGAIDQPGQLIKLLEEMVKSGEIVPELCCVTIGRVGALEYLFKYHLILFDGDIQVSAEDVDGYWGRLIRYEISRNDPRRAWETIKTASKGLLNGEERILVARPGMISEAVEDLYDLMVQKDQVGNSASQDLSKIGQYTPGYSLVTYMRQRAKKNAPTNITCQKILAIAGHFSEKRKKKRQV